mmetsp:Transcript_7883/g.6971  ORF Transcript_7883/g.6971 Transcript_7883/m.6971 type:complete len:113 (-) Transcript_7883:377-715(-)
MSETDNKYYSNLFLKYFETYLDDQNLMALKIEDVNMFSHGTFVTVNTITLMKNLKNDSYLYLGFGEEDLEDHNHPSNENNIIYKYVVGFPKEALELSKDRERDFKIKTQHAV